MSGFDWKFPKYDDNWPVVSKQCKHRDGGRCTKCGKTGSTSNPLQSAHILSKRQGGPDTLSNVKTLCRSCHSQEKGHSHMNSKPKSRLILPF